MIQCTETSHLDVREGQLRRGGPCVPFCQGSSTTKPPHGPRGQDEGRWGSAAQTQAQLLVDVLPTLLLYAAVVAVPMPMRLQLLGAVRFLARGGLVGSRGR
jgi:hypothetical protein